MKEKEILKSFRNWLDDLLNKSEKLEEIEKQADKEEQISVEVVYEPDVKDAHGQWMSKETIEKACENFNENLALGEVSANLFHLENTDKFEIKKTWIHKGFDCVVAGSGEEVKEGTWIAEIHYKDDKLWQAKKQGIVKGVSVFGYGIINEETGEITELTFEDESENVESDN